MTTVLFLCPHAAAKSVLAAAYLNQIAQEKHLDLSGSAAGTEPSENVSPIVAELLRGEGMDVAGYQPSRVTREQLAQAGHIVSLGCELADLEIAPERVEQWLDVPATSQDLMGARNAIYAHVEALVEQLR